MDLMRVGTLALLSAALLAPSLAQGGQVPKGGVPYTSVWSEEGPFVLAYHGTLADGTVCPPSANALQWSILSGDREPDYIHGFSVDSTEDPSLGAAFEKGTFCSLAFEGDAHFTLNWGKMARLTPTHISGRDPR